jgi:hypothetical protein
MGVYTQKWDVASSLLLYYISRYNQYYYIVIKIITGGERENKTGESIIKKLV